MPYLLLGRDFEKRRDNGAWLHWREVSHGRMYNPSGLLPFQQHHFFYASLTAAFKTVKQPYDVTCAGRCFVRKF